MDAFRGSVAKQALYSLVAEFGPVPCPVSGLVEAHCRGAYSSCLQENFVEQLPDGCLLRVRHKHPILEMVTERSLAIEGLTELGPD